MSPACVAAGGDGSDAAEGSTALGSTALGSTAFPVIE